MSNKKIDIEKFDSYFIEQVKAVIAEADRYRYSVSRVYDAYNKAFGKRDTPQSCSSCLRSRVRELRAWLIGYNIAAEEAKAKAEEEAKAKAEEEAKAKAEEEAKAKAAEEAKAKAEEEAKAKAEEEAKAKAKPKKTNSNEEDLL